jgi:hypothetical protein
VAVSSPVLVGKTRRVRPEELGRWPLVARERGSATRTTVERALAAMGVELTTAYELPSP